MDHFANLARCSGLTNGEARSLQNEIDRLERTVSELEKDRDYWWAMAENYRQLKEMHRASLFAAKGWEFHKEI